MNGEQLLVITRCFQVKQSIKLLKNYAGIPRGCDDDLPHLSIHHHRRRVSQPFHRLRIDLVENV